MGTPLLMGDLVGSKKGGAERSCNGLKDGRESLLRFSKRSGRGFEIPKQLLTIIREGKERKTAPRME